MLAEVEVVENPTTPGEWVVEGQTEDGGIRRAIFIDANAQSRAQQYASYLKGSRMRPDLQLGEGRRR